jgi:hypothetical protein
MAGEQIAVGVSYRAGADGATVRYMGGDVVVLPPGHLYEFGQPCELQTGTLELAAGSINTRRRTVMRVGYPDKARRAERDYAHKGR